jgi:hypothetical protein
MCSTDATWPTTEGCCRRRRRSRIRNAPPLVRRRSRCSISLDSLRRHSHCDAATAAVTSATTSTTSPPSSAVNTPPTQRRARSRGFVRAVSVLSLHSPSLDWRCVCSGSISAQSAQSSGAMPLSTVAPTTTASSTSSQSSTASSSYVFF